MIKVQTIDEATHWMPLNISNFFPKLTRGKLYKLKLKQIPFLNAFGQCIVDEDYWIRDDNGKWCMPYLVVPGRFLRNNKS